MSKVIHIDPENPSAEVDQSRRHGLRDGGIVVFPTETVYGIGASATSCFGPQEIIDIKMRPLEQAAAVARRERGRARQVRRRGPRVRAPPRARPSGPARSRSS